MAALSLPRTGRVHICQETRATSLTNRAGDPGVVAGIEFQRSFVKDPNEVVSPGDRVSVRVLEVKLDKQQIALSMKSGAEIPRPAGGGGNQSGPRDDRRGGGGRPGGGGGGGGGPRPAPPPPKKPFNNPFAGLEKLRGK